MTTNRSNGSLYTRIENKAAIIEFGHPASNSFVKELLERLTNEIYELSTNHSVSVIVIKSEGDRAFCAGASFDELLAISNLDEGTSFFSGFANLISAMRNCKQPIIGRVQGKAVGGGVGLVAACDYVYACESAAVRLSELAIGIGPFVIAPAVERKIGKSGLAELALAPTEWKNAFWAKEKGLFSKVFSNIKEMDKALDHHIHLLSQYNPNALTELKRILWEGAPDWSNLLIKRAAISANLCLDEFTKETLSKLKK
ncbi:enoyl-CoA hydratase/isomerase family protein [Eudoraea sp.]|uniref:enoyl-CoA hydratase/isomerase family protein n=1 Tax=Eudoraea sp. TaxID=1979955 RepID=UPI003C770084